MVEESREPDNHMEQSGPEPNEGYSDAQLPENEPEQKCVTSHPELTVEYFRPVDALAELAGDTQTDSEKYQQLQQKLQAMPGFIRLSEDDLMRFSQDFRHSVNITGYSGQGVHPAQQKLLEHAVEAILKDKGCTNADTLIISGGTDVGIPGLAVNHLTAEPGYTAVAVMALPGVKYPICKGYSCVCVEQEWRSWGAEVEAMGEASNATIVIGGGTQALEDALNAVEDNEPIAVIVNGYNGLGRVQYEAGGKESDIIVQAGSSLSHDNSVTSLSEIRAEVLSRLEQEGASADDLKDLRITALPVSGLVTEIKKGVRRGCSQDLLYFAITGNEKLLPEKYRHEDPEQREAFRSKLASDLDLYYLFDDPNEGLYSSAVIKLNELIDLKHTPLLNKIIEHAVEHDVHNPVDGCFGPAAIGAKDQQDLSRILKKRLTERIQSLAA